MARFKLDENLPRDAAELLRAHGHDARTVLNQGLGGRSDDRILDICCSEDRVLITLDFDFVDIHRYPPVSHAGVWAIRGPTQGIENTLSLLKGALALLRTESPTNRLWLIEHGRVRIRG